MDYAGWLDLFWVLGAAFLGLALTSGLVGLLQLSRRVFLVFYAAAAGMFCYAFALWSEVDLDALLRQNWGWGLAAGMLVSAILVMNVRSQPDSQDRTGADLAFDLAWLGLVYGVIDALFLNVMPVLAVWEAAARFGWTGSWVGVLATGVLGLLASLLVTAAYHLGYPEFRNRSLGLVLFGNSLITLAYILPGSALGAVLSHAAMHLAAVVRGPETTIQLPPHYTRMFRQPAANH